MTSAFGVTVKSGWGCLVVLSGPVELPCLVENCRLELSDPAIPEARQPALARHAPKAASSLGSSRA